jgi:predicted transcriptional regulator
MIEEILESYGYKIFKSEYSKSFEIIAKLKKNFLIFKRCKNIDSIPEEILKDLKNLESFFRAKSIIVGERTARKELKDCIYTRKGVYAISINYFEDFITNKIDKFYSYGKEVVNIDYEKLRELRKKLKISLNKLSSLINISKKSLIKIEKGEVKPSVETCKRLEEVFKVKLRVLTLQNYSFKKVYYFFKTSFYKGILENDCKIIFPRKNAVNEAKKISRFLRVKMYKN